MLEIKENTSCIVSPFSMCFYQFVSAGSSKSLCVVTRIHTKLNGVSQDHDYYLTTLPLFSSSHPPLPHPKPHPTGDWREHLRPLVTKLKECVMEVVEKAKRAMTFILLQEAACSIPQGFPLQQRRDVVFSQAVSGHTWIHRIRHVTICRQLCTQSCRTLESDPTYVRVPPSPGVTTWF